MKHGGYHYLTKRKVDGRSKIGKFLKEVKRRIREDLGNNLVEGQEILLDRLTEKLVFLSLIGDYALKQEEIIKDGELLICLNKNYLAFSESLRRDLVALYELGKKKLPGNYDLASQMKKVIEND